MTPQNQVEKTLSSPFITKNQIVLGEWRDHPVDKPDDQKEHKITSSRKNLVQRVQHFKLHSQMENFFTKIYKTGKSLMMMKSII